MSELERAAAAAEALAALEALDEGGVSACVVLGEGAPALTWDGGSLSYGRGGWFAEARGKGCVAKGAVAALFGAGALGEAA